MSISEKSPVVLLILDGWGQRSSCESNAVCMARTPVLKGLMLEYPTASLATSGMAVGLPEGQMGNSEVGHQNIGAGRIIYQSLTRIGKSIEEGDFFENPALCRAVDAALERGGALHLMGLLSDGGVHSHNSHLYALVRLAKKRGLERVYVHAILDGRDTAPRSAQGYLRELEEELAAIGTGKVATLMGRYFAMDRDNRWDRVQRAYDAMVCAQGQRASSGAEAIAASYEADKGDEFVEPAIISQDGTPLARVSDGDAVIFFNFRADRARELTRTFTEEDFSGFDRKSRPTLCSFVCMTEYDETFGLPVAFAPESYSNILGQVIAEAGGRQLRIAETEKYAHVTFFFNSGMEDPLPGEDRALIPSPQEVSTYDQKPAMSAPAVTDEAVRRIREMDYDLVVLNFANPDMVGHTGVLSAAIEAMETVDTCVGRLVEAVLDRGGRLLITADHGNCEQMSDADGGPHTAHTSNPVPVILVDPQHKGARLRDGGLADIAPTLLSLLGLAIPEEMTGRSLLL